MHDKLHLFQRGPLPMSLSFASLDKIEIREKQGPPSRGPFSLLEGCEILAKFLCFQTTGAKPNNFNCPQPGCNKFEPYQTLAASLPVIKQMDISQENKQKRIKHLQKAPEKLDEK